MTRRPGRLRRLVRAAGPELAAAALLMATAALFAAGLVRDWLASR